MKITKLQTQKKNPNRINIYIDSDFWLGVNIDLVISCNLFEGKILDAQEKEKILIANDYQKCLNNAYDLISRRMQSEKELRIKLSKKFDFHTINKVILKLKELKYIDDEKFSSLWIDARKHTHGKHLLARELLQKGVKKEVFHTQLHKINLEDEIEVARNLISKKRFIDVPLEKRFEKVGGFLARKGFNYDVIKKVLK